MSPGWNRYNLRDLVHANVFPGLDLCYTDPTQHITTAGEDLDYLDHDLSDLSDLSVRRVN